MTAYELEGLELRIAKFLAKQFLDPEDLVSDVDLECAGYYHDLGNFSWEVWQRLTDVPRIPDNADWRYPQIFSKAAQRGKDVENWLIGKGEPLFLVPYYREKGLV